MDVLPGQVDSDGEQAYAIYDPGAGCPGTWAVSPWRLDDLAQVTA